MWHNKLHVVFYNRLLIMHFIMYLLIAQITSTKICIKSSRGMPASTSKDNNLGILNGVWVFIQSSYVVFICHTGIRIPIYSTIRTASNK